MNDFPTRRPRAISSWTTAFETRKLHAVSPSLIEVALREIVYQSNVVRPHVIPSSALDGFDTGAGTAGVGGRVGGGVPALPVPQSAPKTESVAIEPEAAACAPGFHHVRPRDR